MCATSCLLLSLLFLSTITNAAVSKPLIKRTTRTSAPSGCLTVRGAGAGSGEYSTLTKALAKLGSSSIAACIFVYSGTYSEDKIRIAYPGALTLYGYTTKSVLLYLRS